MYFASTPLLTILLTILSFSTAFAPTRLIYQFPLGTFVENLAVRPLGSLLLTFITAPDLYLINPSTPNPQAVLVHKFTEAGYTTGITETTPDTFYVAAANGSLTQLIPAPGSNRLFRVKFSHPDSLTADVQLAATVKEAGLLNGLTTLNPKTILAADSAKGVVWAINVADGSSKIAIQDPLMAPNPSPSGPGPNLGINGLHLQGNQLYFTNSAKAIFARIAIKADGTPLDPPASVIATAAPGTTYDDFTLDWRGDAFVATANGNSVVEIKRGGAQEVVAGEVNTTEIAEPTALRFERGFAGDGRKLFVTTAGGLGAPINGHQPVGGQVVEIDLRGGF